MDLDPNALCTVEDVKDYLGLVDGSDDGKITDWINDVSDDCEGFCNRKFLKRTYTDEKYDGDNTQTLLLRQRPIVSIASLVLEENADALTVDEYYIYAAQGKIVLDAKLFPMKRQEIGITYDAGYNGLTNLPRALRRAVIMGVAFHFAEMSNKTLGQTSASMGGGEQVITRIDETYPKYVLSIWRRFKNHDFYIDGEDH